VFLKRVGEVGLTDFSYTLCDYIGKIGWRMVIKRLDLNDRPLTNSG
jgi:hypothetical protein